MSGRDKNPNAKAADLKKILSTPTRPLTAKEKKQRTAFEGFAGRDAVAIEPDGNRSRLG